MFECNCGPPVLHEDLCAACKDIDLSEWFGKVGQSCGEERPSEHEIVHQVPRTLEPTCTLCSFFDLCRSGISFRGDSWQLGIRLRPRGDIWVLPDCPIVDHLRITKIEENSQLHLRGFACGSYTSYMKDYFSIIPVHGEPGISGLHTRKHSVDFVTVRSWLQSCDLKHRTCENLGIVAGLDFQVIDITNMAVIPAPAGLKSYVTLSYVWGTYIEMPLQSSGLPTRLPQVIQDAVIVMKELGFQYLWVDRYCIPQDPPSARHRQIQCMGEIYNRSSLTIIAATSTHPEQGLSGVSVARSDQISARIGRHCLIAHPERRDEVRNQKWTSRGWTYQEGMLSKRRLVFGPSRCFFECREGSEDEDIRYETDDWRETAPWGSINLTAFPRLFPVDSEVQNKWKVAKRINEFQARSLAFDSDAIDAISGVLKLFDMPFLCGLPVNQISWHDDWIPMQQKWYTGVPFRTETDALAFSLAWKSEMAIERRLAFPSWTWAGWKRKPFPISPTDRSSHFYFRYSEHASRCNQYFLNSANAHFSDGTVLNWERNKLRIAARSQAGDYPLSLELSGWTFEIQPSKHLRVMDGTHMRSKKFPGYIYPPGLMEDKHRDELALSQEKVAENNPALIALLLFYKDKTPMLDEIAESERLPIFFLLLRPVDTHTTFERLLGTEEFIKGTLKFDGITGNPIISGIELKQRTIRLV